LRYESGTPGGFSRSPWTCEKRKISHGRFLHLKILASGEAGEKFHFDQGLSFPIPPQIRFRVSGGHCVSAAALLPQSFLV
jgi:hypothetical protein